MSPVKVLLAIVERPGVVQPYRDMARILRAAGREHEAQAFEHLIEERFPDAIRPHLG